MSQVSRKPVGGLTDTGYRVLKRAYKLEAQASGSVMPRESTRLRFVLVSAHPEAGGTLLNRQLEARRLLAVADQQVSTVQTEGIPRLTL